MGEKERLWLKFLPIEDWFGAHALYAMATLDGESVSKSYANAWLGYDCLILENDNPATTIEETP